MRLVDADKIEKKAYELLMSGDIDNAEFDCVINFLDGAPTVEVGPKWIPAAERTPEMWRKSDGDFVNYLIYSTEFGVDIGNYFEPGKFWMCLGISCKVTHWKPLPDGPEVDGGADNG